MNRSSIFIFCVLPILTGACTPNDQEVMVGTLERDRIELRTESSEPIVEIAAVEGAAVGPGATVLTQDDARALARLAQAEAERDQAAARLAELQRGPRQEAIREAQARLQASAAIARNAKADFERARDIYEKGLSTAAHRDNAQAAREAAEAREQADREALAALLTGTTVEELQQAQARLAGAEALVNERRLDRERLVVRTPIAGVIDKLLFETGERPAPGATVAVLLDGSGSYARVYVPASLRTRVQPGMEIDVRVDGIAKALPGTVRWVSADASFTPYFALTEHDRSRLSYLAEIDLGETARDLPAGLPLEAHIGQADD